MKKIKLTKKWRRITHSFRSVAKWKDIFLSCDNFSSIKKEKKWSGFISLKGHTRSGHDMCSEKLAQQDAERLAVELLLDIRDGARALMEKYGIEEED
jgi:hypothetical protein